MRFVAVVRSSWYVRLSIRAITPLVPAGCLFHSLTASPNVATICVWLGGGACETRPFASRRHAAVGLRGTRGDRGPPPGRRRTRRRKSTLTAARGRDVERDSSELGVDGSFSRRRRMSPLGPASDKLQTAIPFTGCTTPATEINRLRRV